MRRKPWPAPLDKGKCLWLKHLEVNGCGWRHPCNPWLWRLQGEFIKSYPAPGCGYSKSHTQGGWRTIGTGRDSSAWKCWSLVSPCCRFLWFHKYTWIIFYFFFLKLRSCNTFFLFVRKGGGCLMRTWIFSFVYFFLLFHSPSRDSLFSLPLSAVMLTAWSHGKAVLFQRGQCPPNEGHHLSEIQVVHEMGKTPLSSSNSILPLLSLQAGYKTCRGPWRKALTNISET